MKKFIIILIALGFVLFAQEPEEEGVLPLEPEEAEEIASQDFEEQEQEVQEEQEEQDIAESPADTAEDFVVNRIFFLGIQTGQIPELRETFEDMVRSQFGREINIGFVPKEVSARISRKLFSDKKAIIDSALFEELRKHELENVIVLLIDVDEYGIKPIRRFVVGAGVEGKLKAAYLFYDANTGKELFLAKASSTSLVKKGQIWWHSLESRVNISTDDIKKINADLLRTIVEQGFDMLEFAISLRKQ